MLKAILLTNFQKHDEICINFDKHITTIVGKSGSGKTTIIRGLYWLCFNQPSGDWFLQYGKKWGKAELALGIHTIERHKGEGINTYRLDDKEFKAFGATVPHDIARLLNVTELNFQMQMDSHFLLSESAGDVAKALNKVINLDSIDRIMGKIATESRKASTLVQVVEGQVKKAQDRKKELAWVPIANQELNELELDGKELKELNGEIFEIGRMIDQLLANIPDEVPDITELDGIRKQGDDFAEENREMRHFLRTIQEAKQHMDDLGRDLMEAMQQWNKIEKCPVCGQPLPSASAISTSRSHPPKPAQRKKTG